jgi:hypothetical protein
MRQVEPRRFLGYNDTRGNIMAVTTVEREELTKDILTFLLTAPPEDFQSPGVAG